MRLKKVILTAMQAFSPSGGFFVKRYHRNISIAKNRALDSSQVVKTARGRIEYSTYGNGLPVLFIHGAGGGHMLLGQHEKCQQVVAGFLKKHLYVNHPRETQR